MKRLLLAILLLLSGCASNDLFKRSFYHGIIPYGEDLGNSVYIGTNTQPSLCFEFYSEYPNRYWELHFTCSWKF